MRAKFINEITQHKDPLLAMGIGKLNNIARKIFKVDFLSEYKGEEIQNKLVLFKNKGVIQSITISNSMICINFYYNTIRNVETKKMCSRLNYFNILLNNLNIKKFFNINKQKIYILIRGK